MTMRQSVVVAVMASVLSASIAKGEWVQLPASRDVWLSAVGEEVDYSMGKTNQLKLKIWQEFALVDFDVSAAKGRRIQEAQLWLYPVGDAVVGKDRGTDLSWITVATVSADWVEGSAAKSYEKDTAGHGATFNEASFTRRPWAWPGSKVYDVILGNGNSLRSDARLEKAEDGWFKMKVDPRVVEALVAGASHGLLVMDGATSAQQNNFIASRESGKGPRLVVNLGEMDTGSPSGVTDLQVTPAPQAATATHGALKVSFESPSDATAFQVRLDGKAVARWQVPFPRNLPASQTFELIDLPADKQVKVEVAVADAAGNVSPTASAEARTSKKLSVQPLPASRWRPSPASPKPCVGKLCVWAAPALVKFDPISCHILTDPARKKYDRANAVWDASAALIRLSAARADIVAFQLAVKAFEGKLDSVKVEVGDLKGDGGAISASNVKLFRNWYVKTGGRWHSEYAIPLTESFNIPAPDNRVPDQRMQAVTVDVFVPRTTKPGTYEGPVTVESAGLTPVKMRLQIRVHEAVIPDELNFNPELNCYGGPGETGTKHFFESHRLAHYHRCTINRVPYGQDSTVDEDMIPKLSGAGKDIHVADWSYFDRRVGPLLSGEAFRGNPRDGVPVRSFYLPLFENWPANIHKHYHPDAPTSGENWQMRHNMLAKPIEEAFDQPYKDAMVAVTRQYLEHFEQKGYTRTVVEMYLNNKPKKDRMVSTAWTLDEPVRTLDWMALAFYSRLFHEGIKGQQNAQFVFRGDISRPHWQGTFMDGLMEYMYANSGQFAMPRLMADWKRRNDGVLYCYGSCNPLVRDKKPLSHYESAAWCIKAYVHGCDGVLPWLSLFEGDGKLLTESGSGYHGLDNGLLIDGQRFGVARVASYRVFALREGAQLVELMRQVAASDRYTRTQMGMLVEPKVPLGAGFKQAFADEAAAVSFGDVSGDAFVELREALLTMLSKPSGSP